MLRCAQIQELYYRKSPYIRFVLLFVPICLMIYPSEREKAVYPLKNAILVVLLVCRVLMVGRFWKIRLTLCHRLTAVQEKTGAALYGSLAVTLSLLWLLLSIRFVAVPYIHYPQRGSFFSFCVCL